MPRGGPGRGGGRVSDGMVSVIVTQPGGGTWRCRVDRQAVEILSSLHDREEKLQRSFKRLAMPALLLCETCRHHKTRLRDADGAPFCRICKRNMLIRRAQVCLPE